MPTRSSTSRPVLALARPAPNPQTIKQLEELLEAAREGRVAGAMAAVHHGGREYSFVGSGSLCEDPRLGLHAVMTLAKKLLR